MEQNNELVRVGIIEDDPMVCQINKKYTQKVEGFVVVREISLDKGMSFKVESLNDLDLILLDIFLPQKNGIEILRDIRNSNTTLDVIIISASKDVEHIDKCMKLGVIDYLVKPFTLERFKKALNLYLKVKNKMEKKGELKQNDIDDLINKQNLNYNKKQTVKTRRELPKGMSPETLKKIKSFLLNNCQKRFSSQQIGEKLGISRVTAQRYLKYLTSEDYIELEVDYGTVGRPRHYYTFVTQD